MEKEMAHAFGKDVYLLGKRKEGELVWLEAASWDCSWYWGFGYVETYTHNSRPSLAHDIQSHSHWDGLVGKQEYYDTEKGCFRLGAKYVHHLNDHPDMADTVLSDGESWELADLMQSFYTLKATAGLYHSGNSRLTSTAGLDFHDSERGAHINNVLIPQIFKRVYAILSPA